jgi:lipopolysaccharide biosynthesis regulator YciM
MDCDECIRREDRLNVAKFYLELAKKKFEQNPDEKAKSTLEQAEAYVAEMMNSHREHPLKP